MKQCRLCLNEFSLDNFHSCKTSKDSRRSECKTCRNTYRNTIRDREKTRKQAKEYRLKNLQKIKEYKKNYKQREAELAKIRYQKNIEKIRVQRNEYNKNRRKSDPLFNLSFKIRCLISTYIRDKGYSKKSKTSQILGCTFSELDVHLKNTFYVNYGVELNEELHDVEIDHIIPMATAKSEEEVLKLNHYTNLQYLLKIDNRLKKDNIEYTLTRIT